MSEAPQTAGLSVEPEAAVDTTPAPAPQPTAGELLRRAREAAGLHVAALAVSLKVPVKKLEALEANRLDELPDAVFVRALAGSVCRTLKVDATPILALLPQTTRPQLRADEGELKPSFRIPNSQHTAAWRERVLRPGPLLAFGLVVAALGLMLWPSQPETPASATLSQPVDPGSPMGREAVPSPASGGADTPESLVQPSTAAPVTPSEPAAAPASAAVPIPVPAVSSSSSTSVVSAPVPPPVTATGPMVTMVFKASGSTWVAVTDAKGDVPLRRTLSAGEVVSASGTAPLAVVIGRVDATRVEVRGQAFNLEAVARDNVARFEVK